MHVMEIALCGTFVIIFVSSGLLSAVVSGREIIVVNFEMLHYHPQLKKCAATSQNKPEYVGCRVSVQTGQCEGLDYNWGLHPTMEKGYAYAKKLHVQQTFQPPIRLVKYDDSPTDIRVVPVVLNTGAQIDISISVMALDELSSTDELFILRFYHSEVTLDKDMFQIRVSRSVTDCFSPEINPGSVDMVSIYRVWFYRSNVTLFVDRLKPLVAVHKVFFLRAGGLEWKVNQISSKKQQKI